MDAGALPELNALELEAQLANDSANLISAIGNVEQTKFVLKAYMNLDAAADFEIAEPPVDQIPLEPIGELQPQDVYALALLNQPLQKANEFNLKAAEKNSMAARGALYPSISAFGSLGTNYGYFKAPTYNQVFSGYRSSGLVIPDGSGGYVDVQSPVFVQGSKSGYIILMPWAHIFKTILVNQSVSVFLYLYLTGGRERPTTREVRSISGISNTSGNWTTKH